MTNNQLTKEWLQNRIADMESTRDDIPFGFDEDGNNELAAFKLALAAMDSDPVKRVNADQMHHVCLEANRHLDKYGAMAKEVNKLLGRIPAQPAPVVPDEMTIRDACKFVQDMRLFDDVSVIVMRTWNACRTAMLQENAKSAGESNNCRRSEKVQDLQAGNSPAHSGLCPEQGSAPPAQDGCSPAQNQGWIPVGERMPGSQEWVIVFAKWANQQVLCWDDVQNRWTDFEDQSYYADMFSHWMPLPAAPQEVKGEHQIRDEMDMGARITSHRFKV